MAENLDSYFFTGPGPEEERKMEAWCADCRNKHRPGQGWFWPGVKGYGPWDVKCHSCGKYIHRVSKDDKNKKKSKGRKDSAARVQVPRRKKTTL